MGQGTPPNCGAQHLADANCVHRPARPAGARALAWVLAPTLGFAVAIVFEGVHDLHVWTVTSGMVAMSGHAVVPDAARHQGVLDEDCRRVRAFGIHHVTVQLERATLCGPGAARPTDGRDGQ